MRIKVGDIVCICPVCPIVITKPDFSYYVHYCNLPESLNGEVGEVLNIDTDNGTFCYEVKLSRRHKVWTRSYMSSDELFVLGSVL